MCGLAMAGLGFFAGNGWFPGLGASPGETAALD